MHSVQGLWIKRQKESIKLSANVVKNTSNTQIWHKIITQFNKAQISYIIVGATAMVMHGLPRSTGDLDLYVPATEEILIKIFRIAGHLKLQSEQKSILDLSHAPKLFMHQWVCFSYKGEDVLDVFFCDEKEFKKIYKNSELKKDKNLTTRVASLSDIGAMKKTCARPIDLADLKLIREVKRLKNESKS
jgi:hypothetical protein